MLKKTISSLFLLGIILGGCSTKDYFGKLSEKEITEFTIEKQIGITLFKDDSIFVKISDDDYLNNLFYLSATRIKVSNYATVVPGVGEKQNFSQPVPYTVYAEDGSSRVYYVVVQSVGGGASDFQLPNSSFNLWHETTHSTKTYFEIGMDADDKTWGTGNKGVASALLLGSNADYPSVPYETGPNQYAAELTTQNMGFMAASVASKGIAAGNIFLGELKYTSITNVYPIFGFPYTKMPKAFQVEYTYAPAVPLLNGKLNEVEGFDMLDMYLILERREGDQVKRLGVAWYRSGEAQPEWRTLEKEIKYAYGEAPEGIEEHEKRVLKYGVDGNPEINDPSLMPEATWGDITQETPTHILMVFTSSYQGDYFIGAPGSKLLVDNFKLIY